MANIQADTNSTPKPKEHVAFSINQEGSDLVARVEGVYVIPGLIKDVSIALTEAYVKLSSHGIQQVKLVIT